MRGRVLRVLQIGFTYMGTVVGAGFATGQEILQFFTRYGHWAVLTIVLATAMFIWLGGKMMLLAGEIGAKSYEDLNKALFGPAVGQLVSYFMLVVLLGVNAVMLAGAGTIFYENWNLPYQIGLVVTLVACYLMLRRGMNAILTINSIVVPFMLLFTAIVLYDTFTSPSGGRWLQLTTDDSALRVWTAPLLYTAFNLAMAQAVLVPLGAGIKDRKAIRLGSLFGGIGIGFMLLAGHIALSSHMPGVQQYEIPMGGIARQLGYGIQFVYILLIFSEIFTTLIADIYGLALQLQQRVALSPNVLLLIILVLCYLLSQIGFGPLVKTLYPIFGLFSLGWLALMMLKKTRKRPESD